MTYGTSRIEGLFQLPAARNARTGSTAGKTFDRSTIAAVVHCVHLHLHIRESIFITLSEYTFYPNSSTLLREGGEIL